MSVSISYDADHRLTISGLDCECGLAHTQPTQDIYVGSGIVKNTAAYIQKRGLGTHCVLVADQNTWPLAGKALAKQLESAGVSVVRCIITRNGVMDPDERACGEVLLSIQPETQFLIAVGSGSITDTTRVNATRCKLPFISVGTAPSMDGYTSVVAPLLLRNVKIHRTGYCPEIIICDTEILRTAPIDMVCSGVGDVLGKYIAKADWMIGSIINGETYCDLCGEIVTGAIEKLLKNIDAIKNRTEKGIQILIEALLLAGVTIMIVGHTRAVASVEHNIAHYWEMMQLSHGHHPPAHGASVGVATLLCWPLYARFATEDLSKLDLDAIQAGRSSDAQRKAWMLKAFGEEAAQSIMRDNPEDFLTWEEQKRRIQTAQAKQQAIRDVIAQLPPFDAIYAAMQRLGALMTPADCGIGTPLLNLSMHCAKDYRSRYTLFKLIAECGLEEQYLSDYPL
ncbi:MAG TPA: sn-glycerol-1-phosphate dehydrogenase [Candidatus Limiplasma sp.]|nr:sn-glycerol-1-phosphate dehydrogenase [Candidatus Limiplasma sp.]HRX08130.1 sn-glycerol-1-phosphate dehydrogenase [Candidatus Limiplasma sp.]